ncbi:hypothetical protein [Actinomadura sp. DC4]|uniref:GAP1-N2 domain-containing protein n=1 Tax=Actinomadura sp. DC4 TaxID=3055069 RepID=UPI0025B0755D|nr:hypothetical protein [Actinomadura sp. DC4]MDN3352215.1 hypothetical protein [Actinomadura sp. DC4]
MAWDLRYTSAETGPTGRSGFQFVATTPGTPPEVTLAVTPYMTYRPPPSAPSAPGPAELSRFPISLAYGREGDHAVLVRCRYTGRDYSGRYGNFAGHAVVAAPQEMEGLRPIELWESPVWSGPAGGAPDLVPGEAFDPDSLVAWLAREDAYARLAALLDAVTAALAEGHGRVVLVAGDAGLIARWIALLSYSLPAGLAAHLSFTTYTADPESAPQLVVGTVPDAWPGRGFRLDEPHAGAEPGRFAGVLADCWRTGDLDAIDAVGELLTSGAGDRPDGGALTAADGAAALLALCRGDASVSAAEESAAAGLVRRGGAPGWVWPALAPALPGLGFDLATALADVAPQIAEHCVALALADPALRPDLPAFRLDDGLPERFRAAVAAAPGLDALAETVRLADQVGGVLETAAVTASAAACARRGDGDVAAALRATPGAWRAAVVSGVLAGLEAAEPATRRAMLTPEACDALGEHDWTRAPRTGGLVLSARGDRHEATAGLVDLAPYGLPEIDELLAALWDAPPTPGDCARLIGRLGPAMARFATLRRLPRRVFEAAPLEAEETVRLAELVRDRLPELAGPARIVLGREEALRAEREHDVARVLARMDSADPLTGRVCASVAGALAERSARSRAAILAASPDTVRADLTGHWLDAGGDRMSRVDLAEIEVRLHRAHAPVSRLTAWGDGLGRFARRHVESALTDRDPQLASAWRALRRRGA